jgi:hypothetical protein
LSSEADFDKESNYSENLEDGNVENQSGSEEDVSIIEDKDLSNP